MSTWTAVYRLFDASDVLLYVGVANRPEERWRSHAIEKQWWDQVARKMVEWYPSRDEALTAEDAAILAESPRFNIMYTGADGRRHMKRDAPTAAWASGMPHWETRHGHSVPKVSAAHRDDGVMPMRLIRVEPELWHEYGLAVEALGTDRSKDLRAHMQRQVRAWKREQAKAAAPDALTGPASTR